MTRKISLLTLLCAFVFSGYALAQREVPPPSNTPLSATPAASQNKEAAVPEAKTSQKAKKNTLPAPIQAATVPTASAPTAPEGKPAPAAKKPEKAKAPTAKELEKAKAPAAKEPEKANKNAKAAAAKPAAKKPAAAEKSKKSKSVRICTTTASKKPNKVVQAKKDSPKTGDKSTQKKVIEATTVPLE